MTPVRTISFVIPCYRSERTICAVIEGISSVVGERADEYAYEIICVDDCSPDGLWHVLKRLAAADAHVKALHMSINKGKHAALLAGFRYAVGDYIVCVDDDGESPVGNLWKLIEPLEQGFDVSVARFAKRPVGMLKRFESRVNDAMVRKLRGKPRDVTFSNFSARKRFVCEQMVAYDGPYPYLEGSTLQITRSIASVEMDSGSRIAGTSGFSFKRGLRLWINGCTTYSKVPLELSFHISLACVVLALAMLSFGLASGVGAFISVAVFAVVLLFSLLFCCIGLLGEYIGRLYMKENAVPQYVVKESINIEEQERVHAAR